MEIGQVLLVRDAHARRWRQVVTDRLIAAGLEPTRRDAAGLAVHEALCNALEHGHLGDASVGIELRLIRRRTDRLVVQVVDRALGGRWERRAVREPVGRTPSPRSVAVGRRGYGLGLMRAGSDELRIVATPDTTRVTMTFAVA